MKGDKGRKNKPSDSHDKENRQVNLESLARDDERLVRVSIGDIEVLQSGEDGIVETSTPSHVDSHIDGEIVQMNMECAVNLLDNWNNMVEGEVHSIDWMRGLSEEDMAFEFCYKDNLALMGLHKWHGLQSVLCKVGKRKVRDQEGNQLSMSSVEGEGCTKGIDNFGNQKKHARGLKGPRNSLETGYLDKRESTQEIETEGDKGLDLSRQGLETDGDVKEEMDEYQSDASSEDGGDSSIKFSSRLKRLINDQGVNWYRLRSGEGDIEVLQSGVDGIVETSTPSHVDSHIDGETVQMNMEYAGEVHSIDWMRVCKHNEETKNKEDEVEVTNLYNRMKSIWGLSEEDMAFEFCYKDNLALMGLQKWHGLQSVLCKVGKRKVRDLEGNQLSMSSVEGEGCTKGIDNFGNQKKHARGLKGPRNSLETGYLDKRKYTQEIETEGDKGLDLSRQGLETDGDVEEEMDEYQSDASSEDGGDSSIKLSSRLKRLINDQRVNWYRLLSGEGDIEVLQSGVDGIVETSTPSHVDSHIDGETVQMNMEYAVNLLDNWNNMVEGEVHSIDWMRVCKHNEETKNKEDEVEVTNLYNRMKSIWGLSEEDMAFEFCYKDNLALMGLQKWHGL
ncbi:hypothetical protein L1987_76429 [Smallanthus sonchifolius]|uniref:Uncharacterized protein n=1 Tax=Smallanthus sonchifolius TaxID=185202 RepID=A0ACB8Z6Z0_9ASTR|nr:hypothetical protein L1987_76429 [Smallanthus sonchifolius]